MVSVREVPTHQAHSRKTGTRHRHRHAAAVDGRQSVPSAPEVVAAKAATAPHRAGNRSETADGLNNQAYRLQRSGQHAAAEPLLRRALTLSPNHPFALYNLGWSLLEQHRAQEALPFLIRTSSLQPKRWEPQQRLAEAYEQLQQPEKAAEARTKAARLRHRGTPVAVQVRERVDNDGWMGSTDRKEETFLRDVARFRTGGREENVDLSR